MLWPAWVSPASPLLSRLRWSPLPAPSRTSLMWVSTSSQPSSTPLHPLLWLLLQFLPWFLRQLHWGTLPCHPCTSYPHLRRWKWFLFTSWPYIVDMDLIPESPTEYDILRAEITQFELNATMSLCIFVHLISLYIYFLEYVEAVILPL